MKLLLVSSFALSFYTTIAIDLKPQSVLVQHHESEHDSPRQLNAASKVLQKNTEQWLKSLPSTDSYRSLSEATSSCPTCGSRRRTGAISKVKDMLNTDGSVLNTAKDGIITVTKTALGVNGEVDVETIIPILRFAANQFTAISNSIPSVQTSETVSADTADLVMSIYDLLENIVISIADLLFSIINLFAEVKTAIVQFVADAILAILNLIEDIKLSIIQIIVDFIDSITGDDGNNIALIAEGPILKVTTMLTNSGLFSTVIASLQENNDDSGLISILTDSASDMKVIIEKLNTFVDNANVYAESQNSNESTDVTTAISEDTVTEILDLIVSTITNILNLIVGIIISVLNLIVDIITTIINVIVGVIVAILDLIISILNAILDIFTGQARTSTSTASLMAIAATLTALPLYDVMMCQVDSSSCALPEEELDCEIEAITCQNELLSKANVKLN